MITNCLIKYLSTCGKFSVILWIDPSTLRRVAFSWHAWGGGQHNIFKTKQSRLLKRGRNQFFARYKKIYADLKRSIIQETPKRNMNHYIIIYPFLLSCKTFLLSILRHAEINSVPQGLVKSLLHIFSFLNKNYQNRWVSNYSSLAGWPQR